MRLAAFIDAHIEPILEEWVVFARGLAPAGPMDLPALRDHAADILRAVVLDMGSEQTAGQQRNKSQGNGRPGPFSASVNAASELHAVGRVESGFDLLEMVSEYRALRATVIRLWRASSPEPHELDLLDLERFNEAIDQSLTAATKRYAELAEARRQTFLAVLGHDLRSPLSAILTESMALAAAPTAGQGGARDEAPEIAGAAARIAASAGAMGRIVSDLLAFAGAKLGVEMPLTPAPMDLAALCREVAAETRAAFPGRPVEYAGPSGGAPGTPPDAAKVVGVWEEGRLRQVISNLLANGAQHGEGPVRISLVEDGPEVLVRVRNGGPAIPADALARIFDPLGRERVAPSSRRRPGSLGLGLSIARDLVQRHGGSIGVTSSAEAGTEFTVRLPRARRD